MRPALERLKEGRFEDNDENKTDAKFKSMITSPFTFQIIEQVIHIMEKVLIISQTLIRLPLFNFCQVFNPSF
jgi:hypothetical protein